MALPDKFSKAYVGKIYLKGTEVFSMGLQVLGCEVDYAVGLKDMEHLKFCFGCFAPDFKVEETDRHKKYSGSIRITGVSPNQKLQDFLAAVDNAIPDDFREQLSQKGIEKFRTVKTRLWDGSQDVDGVILKYGRKIVFTTYSTEEGLKRIDRMVYLALCNIKDLVPDATPYPFERYKRHWYLTIDLQTPPSWFTPLTKLPRL